MSRSPVRFIWIPRIATIVFILFLLMFSLDVFGMEGGLVEKAVGFLIHSLPSLIMTAVLVLTWNQPDKSSIAFLVLGVLFTLWFRTYRRLLQFVLLSLPPLLVSILFFRAHQKQRGSTS